MSALSPVSSTSSALPTPTSLTLIPWQSPAFMPTPMARPLSPMRSLLHSCAMRGFVAIRIMTKLPDHCRSSVVTQIADCQLHSVAAILQMSILGFLRPISFEKLPLPVQMTRQECLTLIQGSVMQTIERQDFIGFQPFLQLLDHVQHGRPLRELTMRAMDGNGIVCVGLSREVQKMLKEKFHIEAMIGYKRVGNIPQFHHSVVIIQCTDGYLYVEPVSVPNRRIFSMPFERVGRCEDFQVQTDCSRPFQPITFTSSTPGSRIPITTLNRNNGERIEYCVNIEGGDDLVLKYALGSLLTSRICLFSSRPTGPVNTIIYVSPFIPKVEMTDTVANPNPEGRKPVEIPIDTILRKGIPLNGENPDYGFHIPFKIIQRQMKLFLNLLPLFRQVYREGSRIIPREIARKFLKPVDK